MEIIRSDITAALDGGQPHRPWTTGDFPEAPTTTVCLGCSYSTDGLPLAPVPYPCDETPAWRLAVAVRGRRIRLGLSQQRLAAAGSVSVSTIHHIEAGRPGAVRDRTVMNLERALRWLPGSFKRILDGGEPDALPHEVPPPPEVQVVLTAGLPDVVEELLAAHMLARRADVEAALEVEAHLLVGQARAVQLAVMRGAGTPSGR